MTTSELLKKLSISGIELTTDGSTIKVRGNAASINSDLITEIKNNKADLIQVLSTHERQYLEIQPFEKKEYYPLSPAQNRMFLLQKMTPESVSYNMFQIIPIGYAIDENRIKYCFNKLIERHESLRTIFRFVENAPVQIVSKGIDFSIHKFTVDSIVQNDIRNLFVRPFDLEKGPLIRISLAVDSTGFYSILIDTHHIVNDGISNSILINDFLTLYSNKPLLPLKIDYTDYCQWKNTSAHQKQVRQQEKYWLNVFSKGVPLLELPTDYPRSENTDSQGSRVIYKLQKEIEMDLRAITVDNGLTFTMSALLVLSLALSKVSGQESFVVGVTSTGRDHFNVDQMVGMFVNLLAIQVTLKRQDPLSQALKGIKEQVLRAFLNQDYPFEKLVENVFKSRNLNRHPLFDVVLNLSHHDSDPKAGNLDNTIFVYGDHSAKYDLLLNVSIYPSSIVFDFEYKANLFKRDTIDRFINYINAVITNWKHTEKVGDIDVISDSEKQWLLEMSGNFNTSTNFDTTIHSVFERQASRFPDRIALVHQDCCYTYHEINRRANQLSHLLAELGLQQDRSIAILMDRSPEVIISIFAILKLGACYVPIDPDFPQVRIDGILSEIDAQCILVRQRHKESVMFHGVVICIDDRDLFHWRCGDNPGYPVRTENVCYILFTSGTSGDPKGVMITHKNVVNLFLNLPEEFDFRANDVWTMFHSFCFDFSVWEMFGALFSGAKLVIVPKGATKNFAAFHKLLLNESITILNQTPSAFYALCFDDENNNDMSLLRRSLRIVMLGGEPLNFLKIQGWLRKHTSTQVFNLYGITEITICATYKDLSSYSLENLQSNIGKPFPSYRVYLLDEHGSLVPKGSIGEIYIGGSGVGPGYLNNPALTQHNFRISQFDHTQLIYKSGDLAKILDNGDIEFIGRVDNQVQIGGFRVEPLEVEAALMRNTNVQACCVLPIKNAEDEYLCAYVVLKRGQVDDLRPFLQNFLPSYMIPAVFTEVDSIPTTANGKLDSVNLIAAATLPEKVSLPRNVIEKKVFEFWTSILLTQDFGVRENFFEIGGHSLKAIQIISMIHQEYHVRLGWLDFYRKPTIEGLSEHIEFLIWNKNETKGKNRVKI